MESTLEQSTDAFWIGTTKSNSRSIYEDLSGRREWVVQAVMLGIVISAIALILAWIGPAFWDNTMTAEEAANALQVRDELFGEVIGNSVYSGLPTLVWAEADLNLPGGVLTGPDGMRTLAEEMRRAESDSGFLLLDLVANANLAVATFMIENPQPSVLLGIDSSNTGASGYVSGQMLFTMADGRISGLEMKTWPVA